MLVKLRNSKISEHTEEYNELIEGTSNENYKQIFSLLVNNNDSPDIFKELLYKYILKLCDPLDDRIQIQNPVQNQIQNPLLNSQLPAILQILKRIQNPTALLFLILENLPNKKDENLKLRVLEMLTDFAIVNVTNLLYKSGTAGLIVEILKFHEARIDEFIRETILMDNGVVIKNLSVIYASLDCVYFVNYKSFMLLFENENYNMRNSFIEIIEKLVVLFKEQGNFEAILDLTVVVAERLGDVNFYVRGRALQCIANLFRGECVLKDQRNYLIKEIMGRVEDKTVIVRKKAINILGQILENHPFKDCEYLDTNPIDTDTDTNHMNMNMDLLEFTSLMQQALVLITNLLTCNVKTDLLEISTFIKIAYLLKVNGSQKSIYKILGLVFTKEKQMVVDVFKEIISKRQEVLYEFINDKAFEEILRNLDIDEKALYRNFYNNVYESIYVLKQLRRPIAEGNGENLIRHSTDLLFKSKDESELKVNIRVYVDTLSILKGLKQRIEYNHEILKLVNKNIIKMIFFERSIIKQTVELFYFVSKNPEKNCIKLMKNLCLCKSTLKIVDAVGWVALNQYYLLERLERTIKGEGNMNVNVNVSQSDSIREKRKSIEQQRRSIDRSNMSVSNMSVSNINNLSVSNINHIPDNTPDEEIADFFFYLKEKDILYSDSSILFQFINLINSSIHSSNTQIAITAYSTINKLMLISSEFFNDHLQTFLSSLHHPSSTIRNNAAIALHDFIIYYNTSINSNILFDLLSDTCINKNIILIIYNLLHKNIIRINNNSTKLISFLFNQSIGSIVKAIIKTFSTNNNIMSFIFYETFQSDLGPEYLKYLAAFVNTSIQESLFLKCMKIGSIQKLRSVYKEFTLGEKFIAEYLSNTEFKGVLDCV